MKKYDWGLQSILNQNNESWVPLSVFLGNVKDLSSKFLVTSYIENY